MPRGRRHRSSSSRSRPRSISWSRSRSRTPRSVKKKYRESYDSPYYKHSYSTERAERSRVHERGTSAERRYKRSHRRSPTSRRRHRHHRRRSSKHKDSYDSRSPTAEVSQLLKTTLISTTPNFFLYFPDFDAYLVLLSLSLPSLPFSSLFLLPFLFFLLSLRDF